ncbi:MAG: hypothetical protein O7B25_15525, partial [Gammaproteobacteria bacterium]|nr:hypothetical protein [Gammaproteobacteria bacterium]
MDRTLANFIRALRNSEVRISTAETLDAFNTVELVGYTSRAALKRSLSLVLPKTVDEKETFDNCFDQYFSFNNVHSSRDASVDGAVDGEEAAASDHAEAEGADASGTEGPQGNEGRGGGTGGGNKKSKQAVGGPEEEEENFGPGEMTEPVSELGQLIMGDSKVELSVAVANAGEAVNVRDIEVFTQKGLFTRRIMEQMGLTDLNREISSLR